MNNGNDHKRYHNQTHTNDPTGNAKYWKAIWGKKHHTMLMLSGWLTLEQTMVTFKKRDQSASHRQIYLTKVSNMRRWTVPGSDMISMYSIG